MFTDYMIQRGRYLNSLANRGRDYGFLGWEQDKIWKNDWLKTGRSVLRALGKELAFNQMKVWTNPGGVGVAGEAKLMGMWLTRDTGIYVDTAMCGGLYHGMDSRSRGPYFMWRTISDMKDYTGGSNQWEPYELFLDLDTLLVKFDRVGIREVL